jgi:hypothetical protein
VRVQHADPRVGEPAGARGHRVVDRAGALRAAEHEQRRRIGVQAEVRPSLRPQRGTVQLDDRLAQRDADHLGLRQPRVRHRDRDLRREPRADLVRQARPRVGVVHHDRQPAACGEVGGQRDVAAEADHDVRADPLQHLAGDLDGRAHFQRQLEQVRVRLPRHRHRRDHLQRVPPTRDDRLL